MTMGPANGFKFPSKTCFTMEEATCIFIVKFIDAVGILASLNDLMKSLLWVLDVLAFSFRGGGE